MEQESWGVDEMEQLFRSRLKTSLTSQDQEIIHHLIETLWNSNDRPIRKLLNELKKAGLSEESAKPMLWLMIEKQIATFSDKRTVLLDTNPPGNLAPSATVVKTQGLTTIRVPERDARFHAQPSKPGDERSDAERDRDRILFSSAFRRLAGVTQVAAPTESHPIHNRLTHSLKVAQIGRGLAVRLLEKYRDRYKEDDSVLEEAGWLDPFVVEAAGLAHDLGHPPFGHIAESELHSLVSHGLRTGVCRDGDNMIPAIGLVGSNDGFEGNAQSFRIVTRLAARFFDVEGLDLCRATLNALLKYPWLRSGEGEIGGEGRRSKWGAYLSEDKYFSFARGDISSEFAGTRSLEAQLMDWADDIAYAVHDLEDFYRAGLIPLDRLAISEVEREKFLEEEFARLNRIRGKRGEEILSDHDKGKLSKRFERLMRIAPFQSPYQGSHQERALLRQFTSTLISQYMGAINWAGQGWGATAVKIDPWAVAEVETLKGLTWAYVIESQSLATQRFGQRQVIRTLFEVLANASVCGKLSETERRVFPTYFQERLNDVGSNEIPRIVADVIASMSEVQAVEIYQRLTGQSLGSALVKPPA